MANTNDPETSNIWTRDYWLEYERDVDDIARLSKGPSCVVYLQRHGYANGDDVRAFGDVLPAAARPVSATVLRARRLSPELKRIPEDLVVRHVLPYLFEDEPVGEGAEDRYNQFRRMNLTEDCVQRSLSCYLALRRGDAWSQGDVHPGWPKFIFDMGAGYDQGIPIHTISIINMLWWKLNHEGGDADVMLNAVKQQYNLESSEHASLLLCAGALSLSVALHGDDPVQGTGRAFQGIFREAQPLDLKRVEAFIVAKIGWRCLHPAPDHLVAHLLQCGSTYANLTDEEGELEVHVRDDLCTRCANVSRMVVCQDYFFSLPPTIVAASVLYHVRKSLLTEETAWNPGLEQLSGYASDLVKDVANLLTDVIPDPALPAWPWIHMGDAHDSD